MDAPLLHIGASKEAIEAARDAILAILSTPRGDKVVGDALVAFTKVCEVHHVNISGCQLYGGDAPGAHVHHHADDERTTTPGAAELGA